MSGRSPDRRDPDAITLDAVDAAGADGISRGSIVDRVASADTPGDVDPGREVDATLRRLAAEGGIVARGKRWFTPAALGLARGRLERTGASSYRVRNLDGDGMLEVSEGDLGGARQGDIVLYGARDGKASRDRRQGRRARDRGLEGRARIERVVRESSSRWVGLLRLERGRLALTTFDHRLRFDARELDLSGLEREPALSDHDLRAGVWVSIDVGRDASSGGGRREVRGRKGSSRGQQRSRRDESGGLRVRSLRVLGGLDEPNIETLVVIEQFELPDSWPGAVLAEERRLSSGSATDPHPDDRGQRGGKGRRRDLRDLVTFTIDGASARDFDDALSVERNGEGTRLWVHIADVSHYVRPGSALDREARRRGTSVYFADRALHMLPAGLSEGLCSLRPDEDRRALTAEMTFDAEGVRRKTTIYPSIIRSDARLTYEQVQSFLDGEERLESKAVAAAIRLARPLAEALLDQRAARGTFEIEQSVGSFRIDRNGEVEDYSSRPRMFSHRLIEEFMIQANVAVAETVARRQGGGPPDAAHTCLFRRHDPPKGSDLAALVDQMEALGIDLPADGVQEVGDLAAILDEVGDGPRRGYVESLLLRSLKRAVYVPEVSEHFALGLDAYCHFTSPIRRYPDLVVHRCLKALLFDDRRHVPTGGMLLAPDRLAEELSLLEQRAERAEREQFRWRMVGWLSHRIGDVLDCTVSGLQPFGLFVLLDGLGIDGLIPFEEDQGWASEPTAGGTAVRVETGAGRKNRDMRLGDEVRAVLENADPVERRVTLSLAGADGSGRSGSGQRRSRGSGDRRRGGKDGGGRGSERGGPSRGRRGGGRRKR